MTGCSSRPGRSSPPTSRTLPASLTDLDGINVNDAWTTFADNLLVDIYRGRSSINGCVDLQLLIRVCYLFRLTLEIKKGKATLRNGTTAELINAILVSPVLLPASVLRSRCSANCHDRGAVEIPRPPVSPEGRHEQPCQCTCDESCHDPSSHCICLTTYISDLFIIKEELARFEEGDIADIENVLAGEMKVRRHRYLYRTEDSRESEEETISSGRARSSSLREVLATGRSEVDDRARRSASTLA